MKKCMALLLAVLLLASALAGCSKMPPIETNPLTEPVSEPTTVPTTAPTEPATEPTTAPTEPPLTDPLTGETVSADQTAARPYAVVINNINVAQPQCGVGEASIIYEMLVEGSITRMVAVFSDISAAGNLGSIRSLRPYSLSISRAYDALLVHAGGSNVAYSDANDAGVERMDGVNGGQTANYFYRDPARQNYGYEHSMFIYAEDVLACTEKMGFRTTLREDYPGFGLTFSEEGTPAGGKDASFVDINFRGGGKHSKFTLGDNGLYTMEQYGDTYVDGNTDAAPSFRNLLVLFVETWDGNDPGDPYPRVYMELTGEGSGYFACGGKYVDIYWTRDGEDMPFRYFLDEAHTKPLTLGVGASYIALLPTGSQAPTFE